MTVERMKMVTCGRCGGEGREYWEEDGRQVQDACYHCAGTGKIDEATARADREEAELYSEAERRVLEWKRAADADPHGEGWAFSAAENGMSVWDYTRTQIWAEMERIRRERGART